MKNKKQTVTISPEIEKATHIAAHFGFTKLEKIEIIKEDLSCAKQFEESSLKAVHPFKDDESRFSGYLEEKIALLRYAATTNIAANPLTLFYEGPMKGNPHIKNSVEEKTFNLEIIGISKSVAEAMILETAYVVLHDQYPDFELSIEINSVGDKDSAARFAKELGLFYKKHSKELPAHCKETLKKNLFGLLNCNNPSCMALQEEAPKPMSFLTEPARKHFMEVLEYIESLGIPYSLNHKLVGSRSYCTGTIFEIRGKKKGDKTEGHVLGIGERYNGLTKKVWGRKDVPAVGVALHIHPHYKKTKVAEATDKKAKFFFIQFGYDAKLKSLKIIEMLRQANIPVFQSLAKDKLTQQLGLAEKLQVPYIIMMGQKEAMENSVVVRDMNTMSQETVLIDELVKFLKKIK